MRLINSQSTQDFRAVQHGALLATFSTLMLYACTPASAQTPELFIDGEFTAGGDLVIGSNVDVAVVQGGGLRRYSVLLLDEDDAVVASLVDVPTNQAGSTGRQRLWTRTGVEGCDPGAVHDLSTYQFESFLEAESVLAGRKFRALLLDTAESPFSTALAELEVPMTTTNPFVKGYPSDAAGCLRTVLGVGESVYLAISHQDDVAPQIFRVFVVAPQSVWLPNDLLTDVRPSGSQVIGVPAGANLWVKLLWMAPVAGDYQIIVRRGGISAPIFQASDVVLETGFSPGGSTYPECTVPCPPPNNN